MSFKGAGDDFQGLVIWGMGKVFELLILYDMLSIKKLFKTR
jgi:hypothetical protein